MMRNYCRSTGESTKAVVCSRSLIGVLECLGGFPAFRYATMVELRIESWDEQAGRDGFG